MFCTVLPVKVNPDSSKTAKQLSYLENEVIMFLSH